MINLKKLLKDNGYSVKIRNNHFIVNENIIARAVSKKLTKPMVKDIFKTIDLKNKYVIIAPYGYTKEALESTNKLIDIWTIDDIKSNIKLFAHNNISYKLLKYDLMTKNRGVVIQPTGTGKMYQIAKTATDYTRVLLLAPTTIILNKFKELFSNLVDEGRVTLSTYASVSNQKKKNFDLIICDELHRVGAEKWGANFKEIISDKVKLAGFSATPYRKDKIDVLSSIFNGTVSSSMNMFEAIARGILPKPIYVTALYSVEEDMKETKKAILNSSVNNKESYINRLNKAYINWSTSNGVEHILKKYITNQEKFIIFHKSLEKLNLDQDVVDSWFNRNLLSKRITSNTNNNLENLLEFEEHKGTAALHSVDMFNEGYHLDSLNGAIFLRETTSSNIYYQQMGRPMKVSTKVRPIIFDFVNNIKTASFKTFEKGAQEALSYVKEIYQCMGIRDVESLELNNVDIYDHTVDFMKEIGIIKHSISRLSQRIDDYISFYIKHKKLPQGHNPKSSKKLDYLDGEISLYKWSEKHKSKKYLFNETQIKNLENINPNFFLKVRESSSLKGISNKKRLIRYKEFKDKYNRYPKITNFISNEEKDLARFRRYVKEGIIVLSEKDKQLALDIDSNFFENLINSKLIAKLNEFVIWCKENKRTPSKHSENPIERSLGVWRNRQRVDWNKGLLAKEIKDEIESVDPMFLMDKYEVQRYETAMEYIEWCSKHSVPVNKKGKEQTEEEYKLSLWRGKMRTKLKAGKNLFSEEMMSKIQEIDKNFFVF
jgi:superfamily II DNA or RNA helicase